MAVDMFLKIEGLDGEAQDDAHKNEIDVLSYSWGMSQSGTTHVGGGGGAGKVSVQDINITKYVDKSTPDLMKSCCNGKHFAKATLTVRKAGENPIEYMVITMEEVLIANVSTGGSGSDDRQTENVTLNFAIVEVKYTEQTKEGSAGAQPSMKWNIATNKAA